MCAHGGLRPGHDVPSEPPTAGIHVALTALYNVYLGDSGSLVSLADTPKTRRTGGTNPEEAAATDRSGIPSNMMRFIKQRNWL